MTSLKQKIGSLMSRYSARHPARAVDVRAVFSSYKKIMDDNGRALEIMTDMGEKTGGGYLFDIVFTRDAYSDLAASVRVSLKDFNQLTAGRHPELEQAFEEIDSHINGLISGTYRSTERLSVPLGQVGPGIAREVGGKSFHLAELKNRLGLEVPDGFVLTVSAYEEFINHNGLGEIISTLEAGDDGPELLHELRERILAGSLPPALEQDLVRQLEQLSGVCGECRLAVRSSAEEEDDVFSFAGQFETVLNVPNEPGAVGQAYRRVLASLFSDEAVAYQRRLGYSPGGLRMAACVLAMVDATASGVAYSTDPLGGKEDLMLINSAWGLGKSVVEGSTAADMYKVERKPPFAVVDSAMGDKETMTCGLGGGGVLEKETPSEMRRTFSLEPKTIAEIARQVTVIEDYFHRPQDVEWAVDSSGRVIILQARPLRVRKGKASVEDRRMSASGTAPGTEEARPALAEHPVLMHDRGSVVQPGAVGGRVFLAGSPEALDEFPRGAILVAHNDSPQFVRVMPYASAIITDTGNTASHMASISREFRVPTVVGAGIATEALRPGAEITLRADEDGSMTVFQGIARELIDEQHDSFLKLEELYEFRRRKYLMKYIAPLNLVNPFTDDFSARNCRTIHDILRFIHEKSMQELIESSRHAEHGRSLKRLDIPFMDDIHVIDIGAGLSAGTGDLIVPEQVVSVPLNAILRGMSYPGAWRKGGVPISISDFLTASIRTGAMLENIDLNLAVISRLYMNLAVRFGYHYSIVDCYCSERPASNHIYFRFMGGAADISKRRRRIDMLAIILDHLGFITKVKGDMITGTISNIGQEEAVRILDQVGRLMAFTRQLDAMLVSDNVVRDYAQRFIDGDYDLFGKGDGQN